jgi:hypothetical protein
MKLILILAFAVAASSGFSAVQLPRRHQTKISSFAKEAEVKKVENDLLLLQEELFWYLESQRKEGAEKAAEKILHTVKTQFQEWEDDHLKEREEDTRDSKESADDDNQVYRDSPLKQFVHLDTPIEPEAQGGVRELVIVSFGHDGLSLNLDSIV